MRELHLSRFSALLAIAGLALAFSSGCSSGRYYDREHGTQNYALSGQGIRTDGTLTPVPAGGDPTVSPGSSSGSLATDPASAIVAGTAAAISTGLNPHYYDKSSISGSCTLITSETDLGTPCLNVVLILTGSGGQVLGRAQTDAKGSFAFFVKEGEKYFVRPESTRFEMNADARRPLAMGDDLVLRLTLSQTAH